jgi:hypothetical protein
MLQAAEDGCQAAREGVSGSQPALLLCSCRGRGDRNGKGLARGQALSRIGPGRGEFCNFGLAIVGLQIIGNSNHAITFLTL